MLYNYSPLIGRIVEMYGTRQKFAAASEMSSHTLSCKLNGKVQLTQSDIESFCNLLSIPSDEIPYYFFTKEVQN